MERIPIERKEETIPNGYVKVVRCKNCKYFNKGFCENINGISAAVETSEYCSRAERKNSDANVDKNLNLLGRLE